MAESRTDYPVNANKSLARGVVAMAFNALTGNAEAVASDNPMPMSITQRVPLGQEAIVVPATTAALLSVLCAAGIPVGAVAAEITPDGGIVRMGVFAAQPATGLVGVPLADQVTRVVDSPLSGITLLSGGAAVRAQVVFYDRV